MNSRENGDGRNAVDAAALEESLRLFYSRYVPQGAPCPDPCLVARHYTSKQALNDALKRKYGANLDDLNENKQPTQSLNGHGRSVTAIAQQLASSNIARKSGWLYKRGWANPSYKRRYFVIDKGHMAWYDDIISDDHDIWGASDVAKGIISCLGTYIEPNIGVDREGRFCFALTAAEGTSVRRMELACESEQERESWVSTLRSFALESRLAQSNFREHALDGLRLELGLTGQQQSEAGSVMKFSADAPVLADDAERAALPWDNAENTYGAFISTAIKYGLFKAFTRYGVMMTASWMAQCIFCYYMYTAVMSTCEEYDEDAGVGRWRVSIAAWECIQSGQACQARGLMQYASVNVFLCLMLNNWPLLIKATCIIFDSKFYYGKGQLTGCPIHRSMLIRFVIFFLAVLSEFVAWSMLIWAGILMIFASQSNEEVIRSTVSITFVNNIGEMVFTACVKQRKKKELINTRFHCKRNALGLHRFALWNDTYGTFAHVPILMFVTLSVTMYTRFQANCLYPDGSRNLIGV